MSRVLLTLTCGVADAEAIAAALRDTLHVPVHQRAETVLGRDFDEAGTVEGGAGALARPGRGPAPSRPPIPATR